MNWTSVALLTVVYTIVLGGAAIFLCVEPDEETLMGRFSIFVFYTAPAKVEEKAKAYLPAVVYNGGYAAFDYVFNQRNPLLQLFYLSIVIGGYVIWHFTGKQLLPGYYLSDVHITIANAVVAACLATFVGACTRSPGVIDKESFHLYDSCYAADDVIYDSRRYCDTCDQRRPARSKHCKLCGYCVPRFDHHCPWVNTCVGQDNLPYFLAFLATHCALLWYGSVVLGLIFAGIIAEKDLFNVTFYSGQSRQSFKSTPMLVLKYIVFHHGYLVGLFALCVIMALVLTGFTGYHFYLNAINKTTNETYKWGDLKRMHSKLKQRYEEHKAKAAADGEEKPTAENGEASDEPPPEDPGPLPGNAYYKDIVTNVTPTLTLILSYP
uniref:Palmitoyltransferase n=2 Tax=Phaeomonas parva TaxID=124430 RepID=A0A7S1XSN4_9STRA|mmetsp:Transcript_33523/g.105921  ORF Transcript_33523/g.105921 Transcript_33523/m.105921 type:complete len:379 (+) Transcript_33523:135-1271(+)